jgi:hypothetical protein
MSGSIGRKIWAASLVVALASAGATTFAAPPQATLTGSLFGLGTTAPLAGATVAVTDAAGTTLTSDLTGTDGSFRIAGVTPGRQLLTIATTGGAYEVATPITLAPGETRNVHLALGRAGGDEDKKKKKGDGAYWTSGAKGAMIAVLVGVVAAGAYGISQAGDSSTQPSASPSTPDKK